MSSDVMLWSEDQEVGPVLSAGLTMVQVVHLNRGL